MRHFGVELHAVEAAHLVGHAGNRAGVGAGHELEARRQLGDLVAVAHPDLEHAVAFGGVKVGQVFEQGGVSTCTHFGVTKLTLATALHLTAKLLRHGLHAVANAQHRQAQLEHRCRGLVGVVLIDAGGAARENHAPQLAVGGVAAQPRVADVAGVDLAVNVRFAYAPGNQLRELRAEVENENFLVLHGRGSDKATKCHRPSPWTAGRPGGFNRPGSSGLLW